TPDCPTPWASTTRPHTTWPARSKRGRKTASSISSAAAAARHPSTSPTSASTSPNSPRARRRPSNPRCASPASKLSWLVNRYISNGATCLHPLLHFGQSHEHPAQLLISAPPRAQHVPL